MLFPRIFSCEREHDGISLSQGARLRSQVMSPFSMF